VAKQKGGVGATTLVREIGVSAASTGKRSFSLTWIPRELSGVGWNRRTEGMEDEPNPGLATPDPETIKSALEQLRAARADLCLVDFPPSIHPFLGSVMRLGDLIVLPTRPTTDDLDALPAVLDLVEEAGRPFAFVITQAPPARSRLYDDAVPILAQRGRVAPPIRLRTDFPVAAATGKAATEIAPKGKGAEEAQALWQFIAADLAKLGSQRPSIQADQHPRI